MNAIQEIPLTKGKVALIDQEDWALVAAYSWHAHESRSKWSSRWYARTSLLIQAGRRRKVSMQELIMNPPDGMEVDHLNGDGLDNRRSNLEVVTRSENLARQRVSPGRPKHSRFKNVSWEHGKWVAYAREDQKKKHLGRFTSEDEAALVAGGADPGSKNRPKP